MELARKTCKILKIIFQSILNIIALIAIIVAICVIAYRTAFLVAAKKTIKEYKPLDEYGVISVKFNGLSERGSYPQDYNPVLNYVYSNYVNTNYELSSYELLKALDLMKDDPKVTGVVLELDSLGYQSSALVHEIATAVANLRAAGKKVVAHGTYFTTAKYYIASYAHKIYGSKEAYVWFREYNIKTAFLKDFYDKIGIDVLTQRYAEYKSSPSNTLFNSVPDANIETQTEVYYQGIIRGWLETVLQNRPQLKAENVLFKDSDLVAGLKKFGSWTAMDKANGLFDEILDDKEYNNALVAFFEQDKPKTEEKATEKATDTKDVAKTEDKKADPATPATDKKTEVKKEEEKKVEKKKDVTFKSKSFYDYARSHVKFGSKAKAHIAYAVMTGSVVYKGNKDGQITAYDWENRFKDIVKNKDKNNIKALVLRVDSGGGSSYAGHVLADGVRYLVNNGIPVIISQAGMAASAAYDLSSQATKIYSTDYTITGSIGTYLTGASAKKLFAKFGLHNESYSTSDLAITANNSYFTNRFIPGVSSITLFNNDQIAKYNKAYLATVYYDFITKVANGRKFTYEYISQIAKGRIYLGGRALELRLVDELGGVVDTVDQTKEFIASKDDKLEAKDIDVVYYYPVEKKKFTLSNPIKRLLSYAKIAYIAYEHNISFSQAALYYEMASAKVNAQEEAMAYCQDCINLENK